VTSAQGADLILNLTKRWLVQGQRAARYAAAVFGASRTAPMARKREHRIRGFIDCNGRVTGTIASGS